MGFKKGFLMTKSNIEYENAVEIAKDIWWVANKQSWKCLYTSVYFGR